MLFYISDGRFGNQLFQLAFIDSISNEKEIKIIFNMDSYNENFKLNDKKFKIVKIEKPIALYVIFLLKHILRLLSRIKLITHINQIYENEIWKKELQIKRGLFPIRYIDRGFFQFNSVVSDDFVSKIEINYNECVNSFMKSINENGFKIFVHVRRGDYLFLKYKGIMGINLPVGYYIEAMNLIREKLGRVVFIILSDDQEFCKLAFKGDDLIFANFSSVDDFAMMTKCDGGIMSNSSFSWWGARLIKKQIILISPKYWFGWKTGVQSHEGIELDSTIEISNFNRDI